MTEWQRMQSLLLPWNDDSPDELMYKDSGCVKTAGTIFVRPPCSHDLINAFEQPHKGRKLTVGARALSKHYQRFDRMDNNILDKHPFWKEPVGSEEHKNQTARLHLEDLLSNAAWKNVHKLNADTSVYEIRNMLGYGLRWTILEDGSIRFRGYLEPGIEGK